MTAATQALTCKSDVSHFTSNSRPPVNEGGTVRIVMVSMRVNVDTRNVDRAGQLTGLPRDGWRDVICIQKQSATVGLFCVVEETRDETSGDDATSPLERDDAPPC